MGQSRDTLLARAASAATIAATGLASRIFLYAFCRTSVEGLGPFLKLLDERQRNPQAPGLITGIPLHQIHPYIYIYLP